MDLFFSCKSLANMIWSFGTKKWHVSMFTRDLHYDSRTKGSWTTIILDAPGHFPAHAQSWFVLSLSWPCTKFNFWMSFRLFSAGPYAAHVSGWKRLTADSCSAMSESKIQICGLERHPEHLITTPLNRGGSDPNRANGSRSRAPKQANVSSSDPNTNWHLINILSEGFISLTSRCLSSPSQWTTIDALITQNSICMRERPATHAHRSKWAVQKWMNAHFIPLRKEVFLILQAFLSLLI